jgi:hypothetical protein
MVSCTCGSPIGRICIKAIAVMRFLRSIPDAVAHAEAKLRATKQLVRNLEEKSQRLSERGRGIDDQIALGFRVHAENDAAGRAELDRERVGATICIEAACPTQPT